MRQIDEATLGSFGSEAASLCLCWRLTRRDGAVYGVTDHDRALLFGGTRYEPGGALTSGWMSVSGSLAPGSTSGSGGISGDFLTESDMDGGLWNGAEVSIYRVDWRSVEHRVWVWSGRFGDISRRGGEYTTELVDLKADMERPVGDVYRRRCTAELGDDRCRVDLSGGLYRGSGGVVEVLSDRKLGVSGIGSYAIGWFSGGVLTFSSGGNVGHSYRVSGHERLGSGVELELGQRPARGVVVSDSFSVTAGCDKSFGVCSSKFTNHLNFRGFPFLLGNDAVLSGPAGDGRDDGGRR